MKEKENTAMPKKKRIIYSVIVGACVLLLVAATILTVYFVTNGNRNVLEQPPVGGNTDTPDPGQDKEPDDGGSTNPGQDKDPDDTQTGGKTVLFISPIESATCTVEYKEIYNNASTDKWYYHKAIDYAAPEGTKVFAMGDGVVKEVSLSPELGNLIAVEHEDGIVTVYRFIEPSANLKAGDKVKQGQEIATVAAAYGTEYKDGTHLHIEMKHNGDSVDPTDYIDVTFEEK